jgi:site-specific DNA recombinase
VRVDIWIRVSSDMQVESDSPAIHLSRAMDYCRDRGHEVNEIHQLDGVSGCAIWDLPVAQKMRFNIETGKSQGLVFTALDRLGRDTLELLQFERFFRDHGACLISIFDNIDTSTSDGMRYFQGLAAQAEYERRKLSERVTRGILTRQKRGEIFAHKAPFGYVKEQKRLYLHPVEAPIVELIFELFLQSQSTARVAKELNLRGYRTSAGKEFSYMSVSSVLRNPTMKGDHYVNRYLGRHNKKPREQWVKIEVPAIVSEEVWAKANAILKRNHKPHKKAVNAYSGLLRCHCGTVMYFRGRYGGKNKPQYFCRTCANKIQAPDLDQAIASVINSFALDQLPKEATFEISTEFEQKKRLLAGLTASVQKLEREKDKLIELFTAEALTMEEFKAKKEPLAQRLAEVDKERAALEYELNDLRGQQLAERGLKQALKSLPWNEIREQRKNEVLHTFVREITLNQDTIELQLLYVPANLKEKNV